MERTTIDVEGMSCSGCENRVEAALNQMQGVKRVDADHTEGTVDVVTESVEDIRQAIQDAGYEVIE